MMNVQIPTPKVETKPAVRTQPRYQGDCAILPIGKVNLTTAANAMFGTMWNCWEEDAGASNILVREVVWKAQRPGLSGQEEKFKVVHTSGSAEAWVAGDTLLLRHDQTGRSIGGDWTVVGTVPHTVEGLKKLKELSGKAALAFATFK